MSPTNFVIFDCDGGSDDAWALLLLLKAEEEKRLVLLGLTISGCGNTDSINAARNMLRILKASGRDEIPVFLGASEALMQTDENDTRKFFHGVDGFGDVLPQDDITDICELVEREHAVIAIHQFCLEKPKEVTVIAVGPLTNIALCYNMYGRQFADSIKELYIMGGNHQGVGNCTRAAEFNFYSDPEAAHIVLAKSKCPITILPWEPCLEDRFFISINWRFEVFGAEASAKCAAVEMLNEVERAQWLPTDYKTWLPCDAMLAAIFLFDRQIIRKESKWHATVDLKGSHTRGQMVLDHLHEVQKYPTNVRIIELLDADFFKLAAQWAVGVAEISVDLVNGNATK